MKQIVYIDMDGVLVNIKAAVVKKYGHDGLANLGEILDTDAEVFLTAKPIEGAVEAFNKLAEQYDVYILSTAPWSNLEAWTAKRIWCEQHLGQNAYKRLILTHNKSLMIGSYLIDDRTQNGAGEFKGEHMLFGSYMFPTWNQVLTYLNTSHG
jgi:5'(3')-deoxyribonucleotidase